MSGKDDLSVRIFRYDPQDDALPRYHTYAVPRKPDMRILDALNYVYESDETSLAHRWYCGTKKCGECALSVNGRPVLACWEAAEDEITCEPLANFPIIRDLVVDTAPIETRMMGLKPFLVRSAPRPFPEQLSYSEMEPANRLSKCIECHVCTAAMPAKGLGPEGPVLHGEAGAAGLVRFTRFVRDPRDEADRKSLAASAGLNAFPGYAALSNICPQGIDILREALVPMRERLFGGQEAVIDTSRSSTPFLMARGWNAFVMLTEEQKSALKNSGAIRSIDIPGMREAYRVE
jgi:succinate dehydrogenase/fumarate reductase iron-sulfur protein